jgi:hypothetical protein
MTPEISVWLREIFKVYSSVEPMYKLSGAWRKHEIRSNIILYWKKNNNIHSKRMRKSNSFGTSIKQNLLI